jgi:hypothetical protein
MKNNKKYLVFFSNSSKMVYEKSTLTSRIQEGERESA